MRSKKRIFIEHLRVFAYDSTRFFNPILTLLYKSCVVSHLSHSCTLISLVISFKNVSYPHLHGKLFQSSYLAYLADFSGLQMRFIYLLLSCYFIGMPNELLRRSNRLKQKLHDRRPCFWASFHFCRFVKQLIPPLLCISLLVEYLQKHLHHLPRIG